MLDEKGESELEAAEEVPLCPNCMIAPEPGAHVCKECGAPLDMFATVDPLESIRSLGWAYRRAASGRRTSKTILIAMWLIFGPTFLIALLMFAPEQGAEISALGAVVFLLLLLLYGAILFKVTRNYVRRRRSAEPDDK